MAAFDPKNNFEQNQQVVNPPSPPVAGDVSGQNQTSGQVPPPPPLTTPPDATPVLEQPEVAAPTSMPPVEQFVPPPPPPPTTPPASVLSQSDPQPQPLPPPPVSGMQDQNLQASGQDIQAVVPPKPKRNFTTLLIIAVVVLLLSVGGFLVYRYVLPMFAGGGGGTTTITWWGLWEDDSIVAPLISEYEQANPGVTINYERQLSTDYRERLTNELAKGTGPDIFRFHNSWVPMFANELDTVPATVMNAADFSQNYYPVISSDLASGAGFVGIPLDYDALMLYVNEDLFAASGRAVPETWDDLRRTALELTVINEQGEIVQSGAAMGRTENVDHWQEILALLMIQNGVNLASPVGPLAEDALAFFTLFSTVDGVWDETLPPSTTAFSSGKVAMYLAPSWRYFEIKQANPALNFKTYKVPQLPKDSPSDPDITYASYWIEGVWARSNNRDEAWNFLRYISTPESLEKLYANAARVRAFGEPYPRVDMQELLLSSPEVGPLAAQAGGARSWYLQSRTFDGPTGINSQISKYFEDAVNAANDGRDPEDLLTTVAAGVAQVLAQYSAR